MQHSRIKLSHKVNIPKSSWPSLLQQAALCFSTTKPLCIYVSRLLCQAVCSTFADGYQCLVSAHPLGAANMRLVSWCGVVENQHSGTFSRHLTKQCWDSFGIMNEWVRLPVTRCWLNQGTDCFAGTPRRANVTQLCSCLADKTVCPCLPQGNEMLCISSHSVVCKSVSFVIHHDSCYAHVWWPWNQGLLCFVQKQLADCVFTNCG